MRSFILVDSLPPIAQLRSSHAGHGEEDELANTSENQSRKMVDVLFVVQYQYFAEDNKDNRISEIKSIYMGPID